MADAPLQVSGGLGTAILGQPYSASLSASGGNGGVRWGRVSGLPRGMTATPSGDTLVVAGTPAVTGDFPVTVSVRDTESPAQTGTGRLILVIDAPAPQTAAHRCPVGHGRLALEVCGCATSPWFLGGADFRETTWWLPFLAGG